MFLNKLTQEEKIKFLKLAYYVSLVDEKLTDDEELMIFRYCSEMKMADIDFDAESYDLEEDLSSIEDTTTQKVFLLEIMALVFSDDAFHDSEKDVINRLVKLFELNPNLIVVYTQWAKTMLSLQIQGEALITL